MSLIFIGISVAIIHGIEAEKNNISEIVNTAIINFVIIGAFAPSITGIYI